jgi:hypothetical protein
MSTVDIPSSEHTAFAPRQFAEVGFGRIAFDVIGYNQFIPMGGFSCKHLGNVLLTASHLIGNLLQP